MQNPTRLLLAILLFLSFSVAFAADEDDIRRNWFWGLQVGGSEFDLAESTGKLPEPDIAYLRLARMYEHFAFEARLGGHTGIHEDGEFKVKSSFGLYMEPRVPLGKWAGIYGLLGYGQIEFDTDEFEKVSGDSVSYGAGFWLATTKRFRMEMEFLRLYEKDAIRINSTTLGFTYDF